MRAILATSVALLALTVCAERSFAQRFRPMPIHHQGMVTSSPMPHQQSQIHFNRFNNPATQAYNSALALQINNSLTPNVLQAQRHVANVQANALRAAYPQYGNQVFTYNPFLNTSFSNPYLYNPRGATGFVSNPYIYNPYNPYAYSPAAYNPYLYNPYAYTPYTYTPYTYTPYAYNPYAYGLNPYSVPAFGAPVTPSLPVPY